MDHILSRLSGVVHTSESHWRSLCPVHADTEPSLSISQGKGGRVLLHCHAGCSLDAILRKMGLSYEDLWCAGYGPTRAFIAADRELRHGVYRTLIEGLSLSPTHRAELQARGLLLDQIEKNQYRTLEFPQTAHALVLVDEIWGDRVFSVPGFLAPRRLSLSEGLLIPVRDRHGSIQACQVRTGQPGSKYRWLSSSNASSGAPVHVPIGVAQAVMEVLRVTEGALKADVAWALSGVPTIGVAGVGAWRSALPLIKELCPDEVHLAFDHDSPGCNATLDLCVALGDLGIPSCLLQWLEQWKGIDDALLAGAEVGPVSSSSRRPEVTVVRAKGGHWVWKEEVEDL